MLAYSIQAALQSGVFDAVICATDCEQYAEIAHYYGAEVPFLRRPEISGDKSPDIDWIKWLLTALSAQGREFDVFSILRPTSPFRLPDTICRAWNIFSKSANAHSLRAVEKCKQHPGKMWVLRGDSMFPVMPFLNEGTPWHSSQYAALPEIYVQNASLEFAWSYLPLTANTIAGELVLPFVSEGFEGFDINDPEDLVLAEHYINAGKAQITHIELRPFQDKKLKRQGVFNG